MLYKRCECFLLLYSADALIKHIYLGVFLFSCELDKFLTWQKLHQMIQNGYLLNIHLNKVNGYKLVQISVQQNLQTVIKHPDINILALVNTFPHRCLTRDTDIQMTFSRERCVSHHLCICCHLENHLKEAKQDSNGLNGQLIYLEASKCATNNPKTQYTASMIQIPRCQ